MAVLLVESNLNLNIVRLAMPLHANMLSYCYKATVVISFVTDPNFIPKHRSPRNYCNKYNKILLPYLVRSGDDSRTTKHISVDNPLIIIPLLRASSIVVPGLYLICRLNIKCDDWITYFAHYISSVHHYTVYDSVAGSGRKSNQILKLKLSLIIVKEHWVPKINLMYLKELSKEIANTLETFE